MRKILNLNINDVFYENFELNNIKDLNLIITNNSNISGLNVTIPFKERVISYLDEIDEEAKIGSVNVIKFHNNKLSGFNTDYLGF